MAALGLRHQGTGLLQQFCGRTFIEPQPRTVGGDVFPVKETAAPYGLHAGQLHRMPPVVGEKSQLQLRNKDVVDLILGMHGAGAGDEVVAPGQGFGADELQQQPRDGTVIVPEYDDPAGKSLHGALIKHSALRGDSGKQTKLFTAGTLGAGQCPGAQTFDVAAHLFEVGAAGLSPAAVQQQTSGRRDIPRCPAAQHGVAGEQRLDLVSVLVQLFRVDGMIQAYDHFVGSRGVRLHHMRRGGVHNGLVPFRQDHTVQTVGVAGTVDALYRFALLLGCLCQPFHQSGLSAAGAAFDEIHLHPGLSAQGFKIALEPGGCGCTQKEINGIMPCGFHN